MFYSTKDCNLSAKAQVNDIDETGRVVDIIVSSMGDEDSDGDTIYEGAFKKTIREKGPEGSDRIKHLKQHDTWSPIGKPKEIYEEKGKLRVISLLSTSSMATDVLEDYKMDLYEHSIGFRPVKFDSKENDKGLDIYEVELWEYSSVTWGANQNTPLNSIKSLIKKDPIAALDRVHKRMSTLAKAIDKGNYTDERFEALSIELVQIKQLYEEVYQQCQNIIESLKQQTEPPVSTQKHEEPNQKSGLPPNEATATAIDYQSLLQKHFTEKILN